MTEARRFYRHAEVARVDEGYAVLLDGRAVKTPAGAGLVVPSERLAQAVAEEWLDQKDRIRPQTMLITRLSATAIDRIDAYRGAVIDQLLDYAAFDLLCYRAEEPAELSRRQQRHWQPLLDWAAEKWAIEFNVTSGIMPVEQPAAVSQALRSAVEELDPMALTGLAALVQASGSLIIGLAVASGRIDAEAAFAAAQLDETYQMERWGEVDEARERRQRLKSDILVAARFIDFVNGARGGEADDGSGR